MSFTRLPHDFIDRLRDLLATVSTESLLMRSSGRSDRLARIIRLAVRQARAEFGVLLVVSEQRGDLEVVAAAAFDEATNLGSLVGKHIARTGLSGFVLEDGNPIAVADIDRPSDVGDAAGIASSRPDEIDEHAGTVSSNIAAVPIIVHGHAIGVLELRNAVDDSSRDSSRDAQARQGFGPDELELATELAFLAAAAVEEHRGQRFLFDLFAAALPAALDANRASGEGLRDELMRWLEELRATPAYSTQLELGALVRELCATGSAGAELARTVLQAVTDRERERAALVRG